MLNIVTTFNLEFSHDCHDKVGQLLIFIETDLHLLGLTAIDWCSCWASNCLLAGINCLSLLLLGLCCLILLLSVVFDSLVVSLFVDLFLKLLKLNVILLDIHVTVSKKTADFTDVKGLDGIIAVSAGHCLRKTNQ